jgi:hypothetical protein
MTRTLMRKPARHAVWRGGVLGVAIVLAACSSGDPAMVDGVRCQAPDLTACQAPRCYATWAEVQANRICPGRRAIYIEAWLDCAGYSVRDEMGADDESDYYYDKASGALVAVVSNINGLETCATQFHGLTGPRTCMANTTVIDPCARDAGAPTD